MEFGNIQRVHKRIGDIIRKIEGSPSKLRSHQEQFQKNTESQKPLEISQELTALKGSRNQTTHTLQKGKSNKLFQIAKTPQKYFALDFERLLQVVVPWRA